MNPRRRRKDLGIWEGQEERQRKQYEGIHGDQSVRHEWGTRGPGASRVDGSTKAKGQSESGLSELKADIVERLQKQNKDIIGMSEDMRIWTI